MCDYKAGDLVLCGDSVFMVEGCVDNKIVIREAEVAESEAADFLVDASELKPLY